MISIDITVSDKITPATRREIQELKRYPDRAHDKYVELTPIRTGNARSRTNLKNQTIQANYPYAERLDSGSSRQAPQGMTVPFDRWVKSEMRRIFGK
jgi:hypothetical protein